MGKPRDPKPAKLISSLISPSDDLIHFALEIMGERLGEIDFKSPPLPFHWTTYYDREMGKGLMRRLVSFRELVPREELVRIKLWTNRLEELFSQNGKRRLNVDPGYITQHHLILATTKEAPHRPYLGEGIYADLTLIYRYGKFEPLRWTYPDYASEEMRKMLEGIRRTYLGQLRRRG